MVQANRLIPITTWDSYHPWPTTSGMRWLVHKRPDGFDACVRRVGRRVLINETAFFEWVETHGREMADNHG